MAHWPSLGITQLVNEFEKVRPAWIAAKPGVSLLHVDASDSITVTVNLDSVIQPNVPVFLYYQATGRLIARKLTNASGQAVFTGLDATDLNAYFAIADVDGNLNMMVLSQL